MKSSKTTVWQCAKCHAYYLVEHIAESCCTKKAEWPAKPPRLCKCGAEIEYSNELHCQACKELSRFGRAEKLDGYDGWINADGYGYNEGYFESVAELLEHCEDEGVAPPAYAYACDKIQWPGIDIDAVLENEFKEYHEDATDSLVAYQELRSFIAEWNKKQDLVSYYPNWKKVVLIKSEEAPSLAQEALQNNVE